MQDATHIAYTRAAYDSFLAEFPLCFGYWKKYAEAEKRADNIDLAIQVYERGVQSVPYSPEIWAAYAGFLQARGRDASEIRQ
jgi:pre-mRNA-processing factor 39